MKRNSLLKGLSMALVSIMLFTGCSGSKSAEKSVPAPVKDAVTQGFSGDKVVDIEYVKENMKNENFMAIDARGPEAMVKDGSLEGAFGIIWQQLSTVADGKPGDENWGVVLDPERLSAVLSEKGITKSKDIVVFADTKTGWGDDGRILWTLDLAGYDNVKILDGGIEAIKASGLEMSKTPAIFVPEDVKLESLDLSSSIATDELSKLIEAGTVKIIDTRDVTEFEGATSYGEKTGGHIPGAVNINFMEFLNADGKLKTNAEVDQIMANKGFAKEDIIVTYCTAGIRSAYLQEILTMNGYTNVRNYDESYYRWCSVNEVEK